MSSKIFCIGFNKTGTTSLSVIFKELGYKVYHSSDWVNRYRQKKFMSQFDFFSDGDPTVLDLGWLYTQYPTSKFIYNTRDLRKWLISRYKHVQKNKIKDDFDDRKWKGNSPSDIRMWIKQRTEWETKVTQFFRKHGHSRFAIIDIEAMKLEELEEQLRSINIIGAGDRIKRLPFFNKRSMYQSIAEKHVDAVLRTVN